MKFCTNGHEQE